MNIFQSIRFRIIAMCILFAFIVNLSYTQLLVLVTEESQDDVFNLHLAHSAKVWADEYKKDNQFIENLGAIGKDIFIGSESELMDYVTKKYDLKIEMLKKDYEGLSHWPLIDHVEKEIHEEVILYEIEYDNIRLHIAKAELDAQEKSVSLFYLVDVGKLYPQ